ncbi:MAG: hypothetical protein MK135_06785, partial [Polyangiaceae bacterium]|nr:hypothetical protein [Polyangiaceae bacterium]
AIKLSGVTDVRSICPGVDGESEANEENGNTTFKITFEDSYLNPTIWGDFNDCVVAADFAELESSEEIESKLDVEFVVYFGAPIPLWRLETDRALFRLDGVQTNDGKEYAVARDFRLGPKQVVEVRIPAKRGDVIFEFSPEYSQVAVRTAEGSFCCYFAERVCSATQSTSCTPEAGDVQLTW